MPWAEQRQWQSKWLRQEEGSLALNILHTLIAYISLQREN